MKHSLCKRPSNSVLFPLVSVVALSACSARTHQGMGPRFAPADVEIVLPAEAMNRPALAELSHTVPAALDFFQTLNPEQSAADTAHEDAHAALAPEGPSPWSFAVLSDLHLPNSGRVPARLRAMVAELVERRPRFVVVTGDFTNGGEKDSKRRLRKLPSWWAAVRSALNPLIDAGIPVFPIAGNHDAYLPEQRRAYAAAWSDLEEIAGPFTINSLPQVASDKDPRVDAAPFSYSVDIDGAHFSFAHIVDAHLQKSVRKWLVADLEGALDADHRVVFGHVPAKSIMARGSRYFTRSMGKLLADHDVFAYVAGHEHLLWDETFALADGRSFRQIIVGTGSASYQYAPTSKARRRAACNGNARDVLCEMPQGGYPFAMSARGGRMLQDHSHAVMMFDIDGTDIEANPMALDEQALVAFAEPTVATGDALALNSHGHDH